ncbi:MAG: hypothetical protein HQ521_18235 [Bacteroidetes bacterium]|nr:hypothetical protein [Bacteroidota bacterium]
MSALLLKDDAHKIIDQLPTNATWDDLLSNIYVREVIEKGLKDSKSGKTKDVHEIREKYGLSK